MSEEMMTEKKTGTGAKVGYFFLALVPPILCFALQLLCMMAVLIIMLFAAAVSGNMVNPGSAEYMDYIMELTQGAASPGVICYHIVGTLFFGLWYYLCMAKPRKNAVKQAFTNVTPKSVLVAVGFGILLCVLSNGSLALDNALIPGKLEQYVEMMQAAGMGTETLTIIATVLLAPIGEEFICRGLALRFAQKAFGKFWLANTLQALLFGLIHGNLIQGMYAFVIGLFLGWITKNYKSIIPAMILHFTVNFSSTTWLGHLIDKWWGDQIPGLATGLVMVLVPLAVLIPIAILESRKAASESK